jgi:hypothetical protein
MQVMPALASYEQRSSYPDLEKPKLGKMRLRPRKTAAQVASLLHRIGLEAT